MTLKEMIEYLVEDIEEHVEKEGLYITWTNPVGKMDDRLKHIAMEEIQRCLVDFFPGEWNTFGSQQYSKYHIIHKPGDKTSTSSWQITKSNYKKQKQSV